MRGSLEAHAIARDIVSPSPSKAPPALDMMRYQRLSPECLPLSNGAAAAVGGGRKLASRSCKEDDTPGVATDGSRLASYLATSPLRARTSQAPAPPSSAAGPSPARDHAPHPSDSSDTASPSSTGGGGGVGDVLLQWGHNKRSRCRRDPAAASTAAPSPQRRQAGAKIQRRASAPAEKLMPPPPAAGSYTRGSNLRATSSFPARGAGDGHQSHHPLNHLRSAEERSGGQPRADKRSPDKPHKSTMDAVMHTDLTSNHHHLQSNHHHHDLSLTANGAVSGEKLALERFELPRIYISLSRKEKEDDFLAMKGTKLPQRPKKRAKNVDKTLQYVFPGMWLSDLTRGRYEVREKKCVKKKRRGLKGMESMDSDSD